MANGEVNETTTAPAAAPETPAYVPPAIAWEEEFEPLAQGSEGTPWCEGGTGQICP